MTDEPNRRGWQSSASGEAGWKAAREEVAARNQSARKAGKEQRETAERTRMEMRRADENRRHAKLVGSNQPRAKKSQ
jgi:hypothetical protein